MKVIITGSTGMIGKGILLECLEDKRVSKVLVVNRSSIGISHQKLKEVLHTDFSNVQPIQDDLKGYDACFFSMGVSAVGKSEEQYNHLTFEVVKNWADTLYKLNPNSIFNYVSGQGTDSSENGNSMWARVKGKTENYVFNKGFRSATMFRPGIIIPEKGIKSKTTWYSAIYLMLTPLFPLLKKMKSVTTTTKIGEAMIVSLFIKPQKDHLENEDINLLSEQIY